MGRFQLEIDDVESIELNGGGGNNTFRLQKLLGTDLKKVSFDGDASNDRLDGRNTDISLYADGGKDDVFHLAVAPMIPSLMAVVLNTEDLVVCELLSFFNYSLAIGSAGSCTTKQLPHPSVLLTSMRPRWLCTIARVMDKPNPAPPSL